MLHNNHLMGHVKSYYNLTIYITYHKHLVKDIISSELNKSSTTKSKIVCFLHSLPINYLWALGLILCKIMSPSQNQRVPELKKQRILSWDFM